MILSMVPLNAYTNAPKLHSNIILGSLQLLCWLLFHPSAWRNYIIRIDFTLRPDFCLLELSRVQWHNLALCRLLVMGYVVCPLLAGFLVGLILWMIGAPNESIAFGMAGSLASSIAGGVAIGASLSVASGMALSVAIGVIWSVMFGVMGGAVASGVPYSLAGSLAGGVVGSVTVSLASQRPADHSLARQIGGGFIGILIGVVFSLLVASVGGVPSEEDVAGRLAFWVSGVVTFTSIIVGRTRRWNLAVAGGVAFSAAFNIASDVMSNAISGIASGVPSKVAIGAAYGMQFSVFFGLPYVIAEPIGGSWAGSVAGALASAVLYIVFLSTVDNVALWLILPLGLVGMLLGLTLTYWRPVVLYPLLAAWNTLLHRIDERRAGCCPSLLRWNSAFWDEFQRLPLLGLEEHIVLVAERNPVEGRAAIEYLSTSYQGWAAQAAQVELDARQLERCADVETIRKAYRTLAAGELEGPASAMLRSFSRLSLDVDAALLQESVYNQRLALSAVADRLDGLLRELTRSSERYAIRFRPIISRWCRIVAFHVHELAKAAELRQEIDSPYVIGVPLTDRQDIFIGRTDISARIEQLLLERRCPPLLLYGQRRTGKTSLLNNLGRLLRSTIVPLFVDLQGPASRSNNYTGFLYNLARGMVDSARRQRSLDLPPLYRETLAADPFTRFDEWLDEVERVLGQNTALLALDEFEVLDNAFAEGRFNEIDVLGMLRHLIQHRSCFKVLLCGTHTLDELQRWASYLINVQVVQVGYLKEAEARLLIEQPVKDFALRYEPDASQRVLNITRGHPFLLQLLCAEIVALKNEQDLAIRRLARLADVEAAIPKALSSGSFFFADIKYNQVDANGLAVLHYLAAKGEGAVVSRETLAQRFPDEFEHTLKLLLRREVIEPVDEGYRFQVELIRLWFVQ